MIEVEDLIIFRRQVGEFRVCGERVDLVRTVGLFDGQVIQIVDVLSGLEAIDEFGKRLIAFAETDQVPVTFGDEFAQAQGGMDSARDLRQVGKGLFDGLADLPGIGVLHGLDGEGDQAGVVLADHLSNLVERRHGVEVFVEVDETHVMPSRLEGAGQTCHAVVETFLGVQVRINDHDFHSRDIVAEGQVSWKGKRSSFVFFREGRSDTGQSVSMQLQAKIA